MKPLTWLWIFVILQATAMLIDVTTTAYAIRAGGNDAQALETLPLVGKLSQPVFFIVIVVVYALLFGFMFYITFATINNSSSAWKMFWFIIFVFLTYGMLTRFIVGFNNYSVAQEIRDGKINVAQEISARQNLTITQQINLYTKLREQASNKAGIDSSFLLAASFVLGFWFWLKKDEATGHSQQGCVEQLASSLDWLKNKVFVKD